MSALSAARAELAAVLAAAGLPEVSDHLAGRLSPPCVVITAGAPYVDTADATFDTEGTVRLVATLMVPSGANDVTTTQLDDLACTAWTAVAESERWVPESLDQPYKLTSGTATYLALGLSARAPFDL